MTPQELDAVAFLTNQHRAMENLLRQLTESDDAPEDIDRKNRKKSEQKRAR